MSGWHYTREPGDAGQILAADGPCAGHDLDVLIGRARPSFRAALGVASAIADILCIASEDRMVHGDIRPSHVRVDEQGRVSIEGWGVARRATRAPEGRADQPAADIYGLGVVLHSMLSATPLGQLPRDPEAHDDEVVERVLAMDVSEVQGRRWLEEVRRFLCNILAWHPDDRPLPLDAANVLASVAQQCPGEDLAAWAWRAIRGGAPTPRAPSPPPATPAAAPFGHEARGARQAPAARGESTAAWTREKIAAMLAEEDDEDTQAPPPARATAAPLASPFAPPASPPPAGAWPPALGATPSPHPAAPPVPVAPPTPRFAPPASPFAAPPAPNVPPAFATPPAPSAPPPFAPPASPFAAPPAPGAPPPASPFAPPASPFAAPPAPGAPPQFAPPASPFAPPPAQGAPPPFAPPASPFAPPAATAAPAAAPPAPRGKAPPPFTAPASPFAPPSPPPVTGNAPPPPYRPAGSDLYDDVTDAGPAPTGVSGARRIWILAGGILVALVVVGIVAVIAAGSGEEPSEPTVAPERPAAASDMAASPRAEPVRDAPTREEPVRDAPTRDEPTRDEPTRDEPAAEDTPARPPAPVASRAPAPAPRTTPSRPPKSEPSAAPRTASSKATTSAPPTAASSPPPAPGGEYAVRFSVPGRDARLQCGDGQATEFSGNTTLRFTGTTTCLVKVDQGRGAIQLSQGGTVTCTEDSGKVSCSGP